MLIAGTRLVLRYISFKLLLALTVGDEAGSDREHWPPKTQLNEHNTIVINSTHAKRLHLTEFGNV
jgi:hypothetical protein